MLVWKCLLDRFYRWHAQQYVADMLEFYDQDV